MTIYQFTLCESPALAMTKQNVASKTLTLLDMRTLHAVLVLKYLSEGGNSNVMGPATRLLAPLTWYILAICRFLSV